MSSITLKPPSENRVSPAPKGSETLFSEGGTLTYDTEVRTYGLPVRFPTNGIFKGISVDFHRLLKKKIQNKIE